MRALRFKPQGYASRPRSAGSKLKDRYGLRGSSGGLMSLVSRGLCFRSCNLTCLGRRGTEFPSVAGRTSWACSSSSIAPQACMTE